MDQLKVIVHDNRRVLTTVQLAESYGADKQQISKNFTRNAERYKEGKHYFALTGEEKRSFLNHVQIDDGSKNAQTLYLWTEKGAWLHAKSLNTDEAWDAYEMLVDEYYNAVEKLTAEQQLRKQLELSLMTSERVDQVETKVVQVAETVKVLVDTMRIDSRQEFAIKSQGKAKVFEVLGGYDSPAYRAVSKKIFARMWRDFKTHFVLPRSMDLPKVRFDEAVKYIAMWRPDTSTAMEIESYNNQTQLKLVK
ncbi:ORF6C domain-containing protein [Lysinibacillus sp. KU-BSD001]|uniref:ORF6C domain-containing protein n=1 Tax=Lysinibacillus sp. KU-BSD001 TaxID=3141328 RepID=UPI0036E8A6CC